MLHLTVNVLFTHTHTHTRTAPNKIKVESKYDAASDTSDIPVTNPGELVCISGGVPIWLPGCIDLGTHVLLQGCCFE